MAPSYWPNAQAADWQRPVQPSPYSHAVYLPVNGSMPCNVRDPNTLVGLGQAFQPVFAGFARPPPAPRDNGSANNNGCQSGAAQSRTGWSHQRLNHIQHAHPILGQHSQQQKSFLRHAIQPSSHNNGQQFTAERGNNSRASLTGRAYMGSPNSSTASCGTADMGEASSLSSISSPTSSSLTSIAGGPELRRIESQLKASARPYVPLAHAAHQQPHAQHSPPTTAAKSQADAAPASTLQPEPEPDMQRVLNMLLPQPVTPQQQQQPAYSAVSAAAATSASSWTGSSTAESGRPAAEQRPSQLPTEEEYFSERTAPLPLLLPAGAAEEGGRQLQGPQAKQKPGFLAKTIFCTVFAPVLVPVLAVGGCLQLRDALSVQRDLWTYSTY